MVHGLVNVRLTTRWSSREETQAFPYSSMKYQSDNHLLVRRGVRLSKGNISWQSKEFGMDGQPRKMQTTIRIFSIKKFYQALKQKKSLDTKKLKC
jgi:hypothetical protein